MTGHGPEHFNATTGDIEGPEPDETERSYELASADVVLALTTAELGLLREALDSHEYWQLSDDYYRRDGYVQDPGSDDADQAAAILACRALGERLEALTPADPGDHPDADRPPGTSGSWGDA